MRKIHLKAMIETLKHYQKKLRLEKGVHFSILCFSFSLAKPTGFPMDFPILDCITEFDSNTGKKSCTSSCTPKTVRNEMHSLHQVVCNISCNRGIVIVHQPHNAGEQLSD